jgi:thiosulfate reductase cytochrome b subunit
MGTAVNTVSAKAERAVPVAYKHHLLVRITHWLNIPILLGLGLSGLSIYWASPIYHHAADASGNTDCFVDLGRWLSGHIPGRHSAIDAANDNWFYNHFSLGTGLLASALRLHWLFAYLFMINGVVYVAGLVAGGGYRALMPRRTDGGGIFAMLRYYIMVLPAAIGRKPNPHPHVTSKYNALQRSAYLSASILGVLAIATGWAIHKPVQLAWLTALFGGYDWARVWHFWIMWAVLGFVVPHVVLVVADGWDTFRSMVVGWSERIEHR